MTLSPAPTETDRRAFESDAAGLVAFARASRDPRGGFGWLDERGGLTPGKPVETWITCRMTHTFALAHLRGDASAADLVDHGVGALTTILRDHTHGGWHSAYPVVGGGGGAKEAYAHAFVVLAAASAAGAGHPDAAQLLRDALDVVDRRFWDEDAGLVVDEWNHDWSACDPYRGVNANMHTVEAYLAAADVTGDREWLDRALRILTRVVHGLARDHDWRLPEHFDEGWKPLLDYNIGEPAHPFRPFGVTIGHLLEWSRLCLHARTALGANAADWLLEDAQQLYRAGVARGWAVDGADGFVYTTDFADVPVVRQRMHWVAAEAIAAAWTLYRHTGDARFAADFRRWWAYADEHLIDREGGSWWHELDPDNRPSSRTWKGKPDVYHAYQAIVLPLLPDAASFIGATAVRG